MPKETKTAANTAVTPPAVAPKTEQAPQGPLAPSGAETTAAYNPAHSGIETLPSGHNPAAVTQSFEELKPAPGNVLIRNLQTGNIAELAEAEAYRLVTETPTQYALA